MSKFLLFLIPIAFIGFIFYLISSGSSSEADLGSVQGANMQGDTQVIEVLAKGGYSPRVINAKANTKTVLNMKTVNTYDCSLALVIRSLSINETLPTNGLKSYEIPPQKPGSEIIGNCSMGMYGFKIKFT